MLKPSQISVVKQELGRFCTELPSEKLIQEACKEAGSIDDAVSSIAFSTSLMSKAASDAQRTRVLVSMGLDEEKLMQARVAAANERYLNSLAL